MSAGVDWMPPLAGKQNVELGASVRRALKARSGMQETNERSKRLPNHEHYAFRCARPSPAPSCPSLTPLQTGSRPSP